MNMKRLAYKASLFSVSSGSGENPLYLSLIPAGGDVASRVSTDDLVHFFAGRNYEVVQFVSVAGPATVVINTGVAAAMPGKSGRTQGS